LESPTTDANSSDSEEFNFALNSDAFTNYKLPEGEEYEKTKKIDEENVRSASKYLRDTVIRMLVINMNEILYKISKTYFN
jgi:hypothetical protein